MPSVRLYIAFVGHAAMHGGREQWKHASETNVLDGVGYFPPSISDTILHLTPISTSFCCLHATSHALQLMHRFYIKQKFVHYLYSSLYILTNVSSIGHCSAYWICTSLDEIAIVELLSIR
jgi:hypothetical protein